MVREEGSRIGGDDGKGQIGLARVSETGRFGGNETVQAPKQSRCTATGYDKTVAVDLAEGYETDQREGRMGWEVVKRGRS